jgi:Rhodanese-related sulfurtransferase
MGDITEILKLAQQRARDIEAPYEGVLLPVEAHRLQQLIPSTRLIDVRTRAERDFVGFVPGSTLIEWQHYPSWTLNQHFYSELQQQVDREALVLFLCRSGHRSHLAAIAASRAGYPDCYNIAEGLEGDRDPVTGQRGKNGWKAAGLPWIQN